ncbi:MAG: FAD:protein FMN transferase [Candidatus Tectimicrobiota bacterium]|nr:MAG: FAD:protein FMN transferase [Candidatus Tectomicrobia bacterium]
MKGVRELHYAMGTLLDVALFGIPEAHGRFLLRRCAEDVRRLEGLLSAHDPVSALSRLNRQAGRGAVRVPRPLWTLLKRCARLQRRTGGTFDVAVGGVLRQGSAGVPRPAFSLPAPGWVALAPGACLDLGGIGKGYAVDRVVARLRRGGVRCAFVNFGDSSLYALGRPPGGERWPIAVRGRQEGAWLGLLWMGEGALATSCTLGRELAPGIGHVVDPRRGQPLRQWRQSTVLAPTATLAEALSTAVLVYGRRWRRLLKRFRGVEVLYVGPRGVPCCTPGLRRFWQESV